VLFAVAWWKKDNTIGVYTGWLSLFGLAVAIYHHFLQMGFDLYKPCSTALFAADCAQPSFIEFGFVSFPFMAIVTFSFLLLLSVHGWVRKQN
jgi:disulfide bond formation protein DsbB